MLTVAIMNHKGGVGKTTTAVTLASAAAIFGRSALLIDLDPQSQCSCALGVERGPNLYQVLRDDVNLYDAIIEARPTLDLLTGDRTSTAKLQDELVADPWGHLSLAALLDENDGYAVCILDCPPTLGRLNVAAMMAADAIIVPTSCNYLGLESLGQFLQELDDAKARRGGPTADVVAIVPTFYDKRTGASKEAHEFLVGEFGKDRIAHPIPRATVAERIVESGRTIWELAPRSPVGMAYARLSEWFYRVYLRGGLA